MSNITTKMLLNDKEYTEKLEKARKITGNYKRDVESLGKSVAGGVAKAFGTLATAVGVAGGAVVSFDKLVNSSQTTSDAWAATMRAAKSSVDSFFSSLATGDFSTFLGGLNNIISRAQAAAAALDALGNANMSYGYFTTRNQADFSEAITTMRDQNASGAARQNAMEAATAILGDQTALTAELKKKITTALQNVMSESNYLTAEQLGTMDLSHILSLDITAGGSAEKERLKNEYQQYLDEIAKIARPQGEWSYAGVTATGQPITHYKAPSAQAMDAYREQLTAVADKYKDAVLYNTMLVNKSDEWLQSVIQMANQMDQADKLLTDMTRQLNRARDTKITVEVEVTGAEGLSEIINIPSMPAASGISHPVTNLTAPTKLPELDNLNSDMMSLQESSNKTVDSITAISDAMSSLGSAIDGTAGSWVQWGANVMRAIAQAVPAIMTLTAAESAEATAASAKAVAGGASAVASIPYVGPALAVAAAASIIAAIASAPKFANGGVVPGSSWTGDNVFARVNSGEVVLSSAQQNILSQRLDNNMSGRVEFIIRDSQLVGILENYNRKSARNV